MPRSGWKEYFVFTKKERAAVFVLLAIMAIFMCLSFFYTPVFNSPVIDKDVQEKLTTLSANNGKTIINAADDSEDSASTPTAKSVSYSPTKKEQFYFDPNTISAGGWKKLGFRDKTIANIMHYLETVGNLKNQRIYIMCRG